jgi:xanthine dehydrogenase accessory factor
MSWKELSRIIIEYERDKSACALATIVKVAGSSYRRAGSRMLITSDGHYFGMISAGCLEEEVAHLTRSVLETGTPLLMPFDLRSRFGCDGEILVFIEKLGPRSSLMAHLENVWKVRRPIALATTFRPNKKRFGTRVIDDQYLSDADDFVELIQPPVRLVIFGEQTDAEVLAELGLYLGWHVTVESHPQDLPSGDARTACVIMSHGFGRDVAAMKRVLSDEFGYIGLIGSRRRREELVHVLLEQGYDLSLLRKLHGPAGLDIGSESMEEISLAIVAEIQATISGRDAAPLRDRIKSIHQTVACLHLNASR